VIFTAHADGRFDLAGRAVPCALGRGGVRNVEDKREGDGAGPAGVWPMRRVFYRPDRRAPPQTRLPLVALAPHDGWCDAPDDPAYNRRVALPYTASTEALWREDSLYDLIVELGYNDDPPVPGKGSAIFLHCARPGYPPTEGCVALAHADLEALLALASPGDSVRFALPEQG